MGMNEIFSDATRGARELADDEKQRIAGALQQHTPGAIYADSICSDADALFCLTKTDEGKHLVVLSNRTAQEHSIPSVVSSHPIADDLDIHFATTDANTASWLRRRFRWLKPRTFGTGMSIGCGDRLGLATPGHIYALRSCDANVAPIFAQQSIREMARTDRTPQMVMDDAMWGVFEAGWHAGFGADADHLKTTDDIDRCVAAGFTFYTFDPGLYVDNEYAPGKLAFLPWSELELSQTDVESRYANRFDIATIQRAFVKYGRAIAHITHLYRHLQSAMAANSFEVEVSVDETELPTSHAEHYIIAGELQRLGVEWVSLAPRFVGRFEKGVDYIGDLGEFEKDWVGHVAVAKEWGDYKLSLHSGSDKFSIYPITAATTDKRIHLKTAGTSYLEALRTVAHSNRELFQSIYLYAHERYNEDRASYHVSADPARAPSADLQDIVHPQTILDQFDARQMLHVCFGSILAKFGTQIKAALVANEAEHYTNLKHHFERHLQSFC